MFSVRQISGMSLAMVQNSTFAKRVRRESVAMLIDAGARNYMTSRPRLLNIIIRQTILMFSYKKTTCLCVFSPFSAHSCPHYIILVKGPWDYLYCAWMQGLYIVYTTINKCPVAGLGI